MSISSKKELIEKFISKINTNTDVMNDWAKFVKEQEEIDLENLIEEENLNAEETRKFIDNSFRDGQVKTTGIDIEKILPPMRRFGGGNRAERKESIIEKIKKFFEKYFGIWNSDNNDEDAIVYDVTEDDTESIAMVAEEGEEYKIVN